MKQYKFLLVLILLILAVVFVSCAPGDIRESMYFPNVYPNSDSTGSIGSSLMRWQDAYINNLHGTTITASGLTNGRVPIVGAAGQLTDDADLTFSGGDTLNATKAHIGTLTADVDFAKYKAVAMASDNGATLPASPVVGQWFLHTPTGRKLLYQYDGSKWQAQKAYGAITVYVDPSGTDDLSHGTGTGSNAFATPQYAVDVLTGVKVDGDININIAEGTYGALNIDQNAFVLGNYNINFNGTLKDSTKVNLTSDGNGAKGSGATQASFHKTGLSANAYQGKLLKFTSGANNGQIRVIDSNTISDIILTGIGLTAQPVNNDTATVYDWGTIINGVAIGRYNANINFNNIEFSAPSFAHVYVLAYFTNCNVYNLTIEHCKIWSYNSLYPSGGVGLNDNATFAGYGNKFIGGMHAWMGGLFYSQGGNIFDTGTVGIFLELNGMFTAAALIDVYDIVRNCTTGTLARSGATAYMMWSVQYSGCTANSNPAYDTLGSSGGYIASTTG